MPELQLCLNTRGTPTRTNGCDAIGGLSFDDVVYHLEHGGFLADILHPNQARHPEERLYIINIEGYAYEVPFYRTGNIETLMTAYPSRKYTREHLR